MIEILVKTLIPIFLLTVIEVVFFFLIAVKDINNNFDSRMGNIIDILFKTNESKMINKSMLTLLEKVNERTLTCTERDRKRYNQSLLFRGIFLIFTILLCIFWLLPKMNIQESIGTWWISTIIESLLLVGLLGYFQFTFLNEIIKAPDFVYFTDSEIKLGIHKNVSELKVATL